MTPPRQLEATLPPPPAPPPFLTTRTRQRRLRRVGTWKGGGGGRRRRMVGGRGGCGRVGARDAGAGGGRPRAAGLVPPRRRGCLHRTIVSVRLSLCARASPSARLQQALMCDTHGTSTCPPCAADALGKASALLHSPGSDASRPRSPPSHTRPPPTLPLLLPSPGHHILDEASLSGSRCL